MEAPQLNYCTYCGSQTSDAAYCCSGCEVLDQKFKESASPLTSPSQLGDDAYLDQENFKKFYKLQAGHYDYQLYVQGMHCASCVYLIEKLPEYDDSIIEARIDYGQSKLLLKVQSGFSLARARMLLSQLGYQAHFLNSDESVLTLQTEENKILLKKMAVAGACAGNIMLFVIPVYAGLDGAWKTGFNWISFFLFLPIVFYAGTSFYKSAWAGLKLGLVNIDLPITLALLSSFILSTVNLIRGQDHIYFDSTASFIFLILASRYFLKRSQQKFLSATQLEDFLQQDHFLKVQNNAEVAVSHKEIFTGDILRLTPGQILPVDGSIQSPDALIDVSVLNGEPLPRYFEKGMTVLAGSRVLDHAILIETTRVSSESHVASILRQLNEGLQKKSKFVSLTDRLSQVLILVVFAAALIFFTLYFQIDPQEAFNRSLALIVLACPCALALGTPLAFSLAVKKAQTQGILIKNVDALEKLLKIKNIFFDKTGTLTTFNLDLVRTVPADVSPEIKMIILGLEQNSEHPIAFALRQAWPAIRPAPLENIVEHPQRGVTGILHGFHYEIGSGVIQNDQHLELDLTQNGKKLCTLTFANTLRPESSHAVRTLQARGLQCSILSGDLQTRVDHIAQLSGIAEQNSFGQLSSLQKRNLVAAKPHSCMIGDGTNDALALQAADVGIAVKGSSLINMQAADIYFTRGGLGPLIELFSVAEKAKNVLIRNLSFSLLYNLIGAVLALTGYVSPWMAAILMPISSLIILVSTLWGLK